MKKKLLLTLAICVMLFALALTLAACDTDADTGATTTTSGTEDGSSTTTTTTAAQSLKRTYTIDGNLIATQTVPNGDTTTPHPAVPAKAHYGGEWELLSVDGNNEYYCAKYTPITYTVTFIANGETVGTQTYTVENKSIVAPSVPAKQHYENGAWESYTLDGGNKTVNATYTPITYTVTFIANGKTVDTQTYTVENKSIVEPAVPDAPYGYYEIEKTVWQDYTLDGGNKTVNAIYSCETQAKYALNGSTYYVNGYNKIIDGMIEILSEYNGKPVTSISGSAFWDCRSLESITIPSSVTSIGGGAFSECTSLNAVYISDIAAWCNISFGSYDTNPLYYAHNLYLKGELVTDLVIPDSVTSIGEYAFRNCTYLTSIAIPSSVTSIGERAFSGCTSLTSITIPSSVTSIGEYAFLDCYKLVEVYNLSKLNITKGSWGDNGYVGYYALNVYTPDEGESKLSEDENGFIIYTNGNRKILVDYNGDKADIVIPDGITQIYQYAFYGCTSLTSVTIPSSVTSIGNYAFNVCESLKSVTFGENSQLTSIGIRAFYNCTSLTSITIPSSVTSIGSYAFYNCRSLESVTFGENSQLRIIDGSAFEYCTGLKSITIPSSVTRIGKEAFYKCTSLDSVIFENPNGWWCTSSSTETSRGTVLLSKYLSSPSTAANYLNWNYSDHFWNRG